MKRFIIVLILLFSCGSNEKKLNLKKFLFLHPDMTIQIENGVHYDKYVNLELQALKSAKGKVLTINRGSEKQETLLSSEWQQIKGMKYFVKAGR